MTVQELIDLLHNYPKDIKIDVIVTDYTLYPYRYKDDAPCSIRSCSTRLYNNELLLTFKK